jgi:prolyl-tRNA editing enzyme YbaK/EbsC (Cys-tRNA(Pro) deacylase)
VGKSKANVRFLRAAGDLGLSVEIREFPEGTRTAVDAARAIGCDVGQIVKSLVFVSGRDRPFLALTSGPNRADTDRLSELQGGAPVRQASAEEAREATGYAIGGTPPFGHPHPLTVYLDRDLLAYDEVWAAAGTPRSVFPIAPDDLLRVTSARPEDFTRRAGR